MLASPSLRSQLIVAGAGRKWATLYTGPATALLSLTHSEWGQAIAGQVWVYSFKINPNLNIAYEAWIAFILTS